MFCGPRMAPPVPVTAGPRVRLTVRLPSSTVFAIVATEKASVFTPAANVSEPARVT